MTALQELLAKVEAGNIDPKRSIPEFAVMFETFSTAQLPICVSAFRAYSGSLDAAKALHEAVLPEWDYIIRNGTEEDLGLNSQDGGGPDAYFASVYNKNPNTNPDAERFQAWSETPARAWLIADIQALIAQEQST
jgi:hypothetical protein